MHNIEEIYNENANIVYKYIFCLSQNEELSEEITQETFAIAIKELNKFRGDCKVSVWLCQIAKHLWYKELKKNKLKRQIPLDDVKENIISNELEEQYFLKEDKLQLYKSMQKLDSKTKEVMYLRLMGNLNFNEIAEILNKTPNWARVTFFRGKQKIKEERKDGEKE